MSATAQEDAEKLRDEGLRLWGKLRAVGARGIAKAVEAVSYTHLTLPTIYSV